jgi:SAM-dependent methyltransferase
MTIDPSEHWDRQAPTYADDEGHRGFGRFLDLYEESCWSHVQPLLPPSSTGVVLEAGCGAGRWVFRLAPLGYRLVLSDLSAEMIAHARQKVERRALGDRVLGYHVRDICDMHPLPDDTFDLTLALGGPLTLCRDPGSAVSEFRRLTKPGGYVLCDAANRYRTALDLLQARRVDQLAAVLQTGRFSRPDGLTDRRFTPQELEALFRDRALVVRSLVGVCPLFGFLPTQDEVRILDHDAVWETMRGLARDHGAGRALASLSGRLLIVAQRPE